MLDYLLVGQGTAGTCMAYRLLKAGYSVKILDNHHTYSSSTAAAGIINPITGRHYAKSWMIDLLLPEAEDFYRELEALLGISILTQQSIIRTFHDVKGENNWWSRMDKRGYAAYMSQQPALGKLEDMVHEPLGYGEVLKAFQVDLPLFLQKFRNHYSECIIDAEVDYNGINVNENTVEYNNLIARNILFADGYKAIHNPFFQYLPFQPAKGEALIIQIPGYNGTKILRDKIFLCPIGGDIYWAGAGYAWDDLNEETTDEERKRLVSKLEKFLKVPYTILDQKAGVRPSTKDRRPFLGTHPKFNNVHIFNGMGTKGTSLSPYWSLKMKEYLEAKSELSEEVDIARFA